MNDKEILINEVKSAIGLDDLSKLDKESTEMILQLIGKQRLTEAHISAIVEVAPHFVQLQTEVLKTVSKAIDGLESSQRSALETMQITLKGLINILQTLAEKMESDDGRLKIAEYTIKAGEQFIAVSKTLESMNKENNRIWKWVIGGVATGLTLFAGIVSAKVMGDKK